MNKYQFDCWLNSKKENSTQRYVSTSFGKVRYIEAGAKNKPALVMVPDGPCVAEHFEKLIRELQNDYRVIVFDLPGFGFSLPQNGYNHSLQSGADAIREVFDALAIKSATVAFSCANGFYAVVLATQHPRLVSRLVLCQTPSIAEMENWVERRIPSILKIGFVGQAFSYLMKKRAPKLWFPVALRKEENQKEWIDVSLKNVTSGGCNCLASVVQGLGESDKSIPIDVKCPTVMIWGKQDKSHKPTDPQSFLKLVPHAQIEIWDHVGHFANLEDPYRFKLLLLSFSSLR